MPASQLLTRGTPSPDFAAVSHTGGKVTLRQFLDKPVLLLFYDGDGSAASAPLFAALKAQWLLLRPKISMVLAVSAQHAVEHAAYAVAEELPFLLLADVDQRIAAAYGVPHAKQPVVAFLVNTDSTIGDVMLSPRPEELLPRLKSGPADAPQ